MSDINFADPIYTPESVIDKITSLWGGDICDVSIWNGDVTDIHLDQNTPLKISY
jgi:hypothetical protein